MMRHDARSIIVDSLVSRRDGDVHRQSQRPVGHLQEVRQITFSGEVRQLGEWQALVHTMEEDAKLVTTSRQMNAETTSTHADTITSLKRLTIQRRHHRRRIGKCLILDLRAMRCLRKSFTKMPIGLSPARPLRRAPGSVPTERLGPDLASPHDIQFLKKIIFGAPRNNFACGPVSEHQILLASFKASDGAGGSKNCRRNPLCIATGQT